MNETDRESKKLYIVLGTIAFLIIIIAGMVVFSPEPEPTEVETMPHVNWEVVAVIGMHNDTGFDVYRFAVDSVEYLVSSGKNGGVVVLDAFALTK